MKSGQSALPVRLIESLQDLPAIAIAFSGGIDSRFLCHAATLCGCDVLAIHVTGSHIPEDDSEWARQWAEGFGMRFIEVSCNPLSIEAVACNSRRRCYFCKQAILRIMRECLNRNGEANRCLCDGSNMDDQSVFRPGRKALEEAGVISPLALAKMTKAQIRDAASKSGLDWPDQPSRPCLLTRFPYNHKIDPVELHLVQKIEKKIREVLADLSDAPDFRLRFCPQPVLHVNKPLPAARNEITGLLRENGLSECKIEILSDLSGFFDYNS